jgi:cell division FtsZ-interacting protein ZapD
MSVNRCAVYEFILDETLRHLGKIAYHYEYLKSQKDSNPQQALEACFHLLNLTNRFDLKTKLLSLMQVQQKALATHALNPAVDSQKIADQQTQINQWISQLEHQANPTIAWLKNPWIQIIQPLFNQPGGLMPNIHPYLDQWYQQNNHEKQLTLQKFIDDYQSLYAPISGCLRHLRQSKKTAKCHAESGFYHNTQLSSKQIYMIQIQVQMPCFPEISFSTRHLAIHFLHLSNIDQAPSKVDHDISFSLALCQF